MENNESRIPPSGQKQRLFKEHDLLPTRGICNVCQAEFQISIDQWLIAVCLSLFSFQTLILFFFFGWIFHHFMMDAWAWGVPSFKVEIITKWWIYSLMPWLDKILRMSFLGCVSLCRRKGNKCLWFRGQSVLIDYWSQVFTPPLSPYPSHWRSVFPHSTFFFFKLAMSLNLAKWNE